MRLKINWQLRSSSIEKYLLLRYYNWWPSAKKAEPAIIIMLNNKIKHGGLLDRLKGIISAKIIAEKNNLPFKIYSDNSSFNLCKYLLPKNQHTYLTKDELSMSAHVSRPVVMYNTLAFSEADIMSRFRHKKRAYHLYTNLDFSAALHPLLNTGELQQQWKKQFFQLFSFADNISFPGQKIINGIATCGIHLRFTSILGDFDEAVNKPLPDEQKQLLIASCVQAVSQLIQQEKFQQFLVVSDSGTFLNTLKQIPANTFGNKLLLVPPGKIGHVDVHYDDEVLEKSVLDFYLLSQCKKIIQVKAKQMYNSQYSKYAAITGDAEYILHKI